MFNFFFPLNVSYFPVCYFFCMTCDIFVELWTFESNNVITGNQIFHLFQGLLLLLLLLLVFVGLFLIVVDCLFTMDQTEV